MKALRFVLLGLALAVVGALVFRLIGMAPVPGQAPSSRPSVVSVQPKDPDARALVLSRLGDAPDYVAFYDRLRTEFAAEYAGLLERASAATQKTGRPPNPERLLMDALRNLRQISGVLAAQADAQPLSEIFSAQSALLDTLGPHDPALCTDFLYGGSSPGFMAFSATHRELLGRFAMATLNAIASGRAKHIPRDQPTAADFDRLTEALRAQNLSEDQIAALLDGKTFDPPLPEKQLCDAGRTYLHVLSDMPEDLRLRIYGLSAQLLARS